VLSESRLSALLEPFGVKLDASQTDRLLLYLDLLLRWNKRINLTSIKNPEDCVSRHFGESLFISKLFELQGSLLDIGSGAGFPGLAIKIVSPAVSVTLLEPVAKKRAFLKEVARTCQLAMVDVRGERFVDYLAGSTHLSFEAVTARAVGGLEQLVPNVARCLKPHGRLCLWLGWAQLAGLAKLRSPITWLDPVPLPNSQQRVVAIGQMPGLAEE
jgi:16S rRNA (guanine527-N7)-methyltransferase